jgi:hypothetical protein
VNLSHQILLVEHEIEVLLELETGIQQYDQFHSLTGMIFTKSVRLNIDDPNLVSSQRIKGIFTYLTQ